MRRRMYIPDEVKRSIREHLATAVQDTIETYESAEEDEDTMTGHLGAKLQVRTRSVMVHQGEIAGEWKWSLNYYKFRGRGPRPTENFLGADGIFELQLSIQGRVEAKSLLFQSKMGSAGGVELLQQCIKLSTWREAAFVASYSKDGFTAVPLDRVIRTRGSADSFEQAKPLGEYLGQDFLNCSAGDDELRYESRSRSLTWRTASGEVVSTAFAVKHRLRVEVVAPGSGKLARRTAREIPPEEVHLYRMQATADEILGLTTSSPERTLGEARRELALLYHPDRFSTLEPQYQQIMTRRMQEANEACDLLDPIKKHS